MILMVLPNAEGQLHRHACDRYQSLLMMMCLWYLWTRMRPEVEAVVAGDEPMVDVATQDTGAETDAQDTGAEIDGDE